MISLISTIDKLVAEMSEAEQKFYTYYFLEVLEIGMAMELDNILDKQIESLFCTVLGAKQIMTIDYKSNYHIKIKLGEFNGHREIDVIPYKLVEGKEVIGCTNDIAIKPISEALMNLYPNQNRFTDKLLTLLPKSDLYNYHPCLAANKSTFTNELLKEVPNPFFKQPKLYPNQNNFASMYFTTTLTAKLYNNYNPLIMFAYKKQWANDIIKELNEVIALVKKIAAD